MNAQCHSERHAASQLTTSLDRTPTCTLLGRFIMMDGRIAMRRLRNGLAGRRRALLASVDLKIPDSRVAREATALVRRASPAFVVNHAVRSYLFGAAIAKRDGVRVDHELLYCGAVMHDLGLSPEFDGPGSFEVNGAAAARHLCLEHGMPEARADIVHEAIALHAAVGIASNRGPEVAMVHFGSGADLFGLRLNEIAPATVEWIVGTWPRLDFKTGFTALIEDQARRKPECHIAGHLRLGLAKRIAKGPLPDS